jgi:hypothetical protein
MRCAFGIGVAILLPRDVARERMPAESRSTRLRKDQTRHPCPLPGLPIPLVSGAVCLPRQRRPVHYSARCEQDVATIFNDLTANVPVVFLSSSLTAPLDTGCLLPVVPVVPVTQCAACTPVTETV